MTILLIWVLDLSKLRWHGMNRKSPWWAMLHSASASSLAVVATWDLSTIDPPWVLPVLWGALSWLVVYYSWEYLWTTPEGNWWSKPLWVRNQKCYRVVDGVVDYDHYMVVERPGPDRWHLLSFLSSWPVEVDALWKLSSNACSENWMGAHSFLAHYVSGDMTLYLIAVMVYLIIFAALAASVPFILWTDLLLKVTGKEWLRMRPTHWRKSLWSR